MKIIVGLGNPGPEYRLTRHNVGFRVLECLADRFGAPFSREKHESLITEVAMGGERVLLVKPLTFMNRSGLAVARAVRYTSAAPADLLVVVDDVNLPLGRLRLRSEGSAGGHNGLKSIIAHIGTMDFPRLRMGVGPGRDGAGLVGHVLGKFSADEKPEVEKMILRGADAAEWFVTRGLEPAMNEFN